jgi:dTDP-D-glucose 4,6-dehydratase
VPWINNTMEDLGWKPEVSVEDALRKIFDAYSHEVAAARELIDQDLTL